MPSVNEAKIDMLDGLGDLDQAEGGIGAINDISGLILGDEPAPGQPGSGQGSPSFNAAYQAVYPTQPITMTVNGVSSTYADFPKLLAGVKALILPAVNALPDQIPDQPGQ